MAKYHTPSSTRSAINPLAEKAGWKVNNFDSYAEFWVRSVDDWVRATDDPAYVLIVTPDEERLLDKSRTEVTFGWEQVRVQDGRVVDGRLV